MWSLLLFAMLYYPTYRLVLTMSVRRLQKKLKKELDEQEVSGQTRRAHFITIILLVIFSATYNAYRFGQLGGF